jgi:hypothetical protein
LVEACYGEVLLTKLPMTLLVEANTTSESVLKAGEDKITVTWSFNQSLSPGTDSVYKIVKLNLCYAPISQVDRAWRKTDDHLKKDKTCQFKIVAKPYSPSNNSFTYTVKKSIPTATYFIRAYVVNSDDVQVGYGQTTDMPKKQQNLFKVEGVTGRHPSLYIASACFSGFSIFALLGFFYLDRRAAKMK